VLVLNPGVNPIHEAINLKHPARISKRHFPNDLPTQIEVLENQRKKVKHSADETSGNRGVNGAEARKLVLILVTRHRTVKQRAKPLGYYC